MAKIARLEQETIDRLTKLKGRENEISAKVL